MYCTLIKLNRKGEISNTEANQIIPKTVRTPIMYILVKTHKPDFKTNTKIRPIISAYDSYCENLAKFLTKKLRTVLNKNSTGMKQSTFDFVEKLNNLELNLSELKMITMDVTNMYPSIPLDIAINYAIEIIKRENETNINTEDLVKLFEFCTKELVFTFENKYYKQINGVTMGSPLAPILAHCYMLNIDEKIQNLTPAPIFYYRYVDDCFALVSKQLILPEYSGKVNALDSRVKFEITEEHNNKITFLDVEVIKKRKIKTNWYVKPSNTGKFMEWSSAIYKGYKIGIIKNMTLRILKYVSKEYIKSSLAKLKKFLRFSKFPRDVVSSVINREIKKFKYQKEKKNSQNQKQKILRFGFKYENKNTVYLAKRVSQLLKEEKREMKVVPYYKNGKNLIGYFAKQYKQQGKNYDMSGVYKIECKTCNKCYIGETGRSIDIRMKEHQFKSSKTTITSHHYTSGHVIDFKNPKVLAIEKDPIKRKYLEFLHIKDAEVLVGNTSSIPPWIFKDG